MTGDVVEVADVCFSMMIVYLPVDRLLVEHVQCFYKVLCQGCVKLSRNTNPYAYNQMYRQYEDHGR